MGSEWKLYITPIEIVVISFLAMYVGQEIREMMSNGEVLSLGLTAPVMALFLSLVVAPIGGLMLSH